MCNLTTGFGLDCKTGIGGIYEVFFVPLSDIPSADISYDATTDVIDGLPSFTAYRYSLSKNLSTFSDTLAYEEGGSVHFQQALNLIIKNMTPSKRKELNENVGRNTVVAFVRLNEHPITGSKQLIALGLYNGLDVTSNAASPGTTLGDMSGYTFAATGDEPISAPFLEAWTNNPFDNFAGVTVDPPYAT